MRLYTWSRNSAGERVRIALNLKRIACELVSAMDLPPGEYAKINPQGLMPALEVDGQVIAQSGAILAFLEEGWPEPPLLPKDPVLRARARAFAAHIASEMHAITVGRVRKQLAAQFGADEPAQAAWVRHWLGLGLEALEAELGRRPKDWPFCFGERPGWADLHLVPQLKAARRLGCDLSGYPRLVAADANCIALEEFQLAIEHDPQFGRLGGV